MGKDVGVSEMVQAKQWREGWPSGLKKPFEAAEAIGIEEGRLIELTKAGYIPHYLIDGTTPAYQLKEVKEWASDNLLAHNKGKPLPQPVNIIAPDPIADRVHMPPALSVVPGLYQIPGILRSGIYFLCEANDVVYVGQSVNVAARVGDHQNSKKFDQIYYLPWPPDDLDRIEGAFIRAIKPRFNGGGLKRLCAPGYPSQDAEALNTAGAAHILSQAVKEERMAA
jgi:hypothetical protein